MKNSQKINVFIVDDNDDLIQDIVKLFRTSTLFRYFDKANDPEECLQKLEKQVDEIDIILMDVHFPNFEIDGIQLARQVRRQHPGNSPKIAFLTIGDRAIVDTRNGFHGHIPKNKGIAELMQMLEAIHYHEAVFHPPQSPAQTFIDKLTSRQRIIFCLILRGVDHESIAKQLNISRITLATHKKVILSKIRQSSVAVDRIDHPEILEIARANQLCDST